MENKQKALELLNIPSEFEEVNGQVNTVTDNIIIIEKTFDFLRKGASDAVKPENISIKITTGSQVVLNSDMINTIDPLKTKSISLFGAYSYNMIANYIHGFNYQHIPGTKTLVKDNRSFVCEPTSDGWDLKTLNNPFIASSDKVNPTLMGGTFIVLNRIISGQKSVKADGTVTIIKENITVNRHRRATVTKNELESWGFDFNEIQNATAKVFNVKTVNPSTHVTSMAMDVELTDNSYKGVVYINGVKFNEIPYTSLMASYGKLFPNFIFRWMLYNGQNNSMTTGATWLKQYSASENNTIIVNSGETFNVNGNEVTFNNNSPAELIAYMECLPAQGKNENTGALVDLKTGLEKLWA
jgi:hypothetical protein